MKVRDVVRLVLDDGWYLARIRGSPHQYTHLRKPGRVTGPGYGNDDLAPATLSSVLKQAGPEGAAAREVMQRYLIVIEPSGTGFSAYFPDLPGWQRHRHDASATLGRSTFRA